jgi:hypothetical protein
MAADRIFGIKAFRQVWDQMSGLVELQRRWS